MSRTRTARSRVERVYGPLAARYDARWAHYLSHTTAWALERLGTVPHARVLDVGCGTGLLLEQLGRREPTAFAVGVDLTMPMLRVAQGRLIGLTLVQASGEALPLPAAHFDRVISTSALHYLDDPLTVLREMYRVLVPGGTLVVSDWCGDYLAMRALDVALRTVLRPLDAAHGRVLRSDALADRLHRAGFTDITVERRRIDRFWGIMTLTAVAQRSGTV